MFKRKARGLRKGTEKEVSQPRISCFTAFLDECSIGGEGTSASQRNGFKSMRPEFFVLDVILAQEGAYCSFIPPANADDLTAASAR
jgi:hypothetical protein